MLSKKRIKTLLGHLNFENNHGSSIWHRKDVTCFFGRSNGESIFGMSKLPSNISFKLDDIEYKDIFDFFKDVDSMKQEVRELQLSYLLDDINDLRSRKKINKKIKTLG